MANRNDCNRAAQKSIPKRTTDGTSLIADLAGPDFKNTKAQEMNWDRTDGLGNMDSEVGT